MEKDDRLDCSLCEGKIEIKQHWREGHNAQPLSNDRCCDVCNVTKVIPVRIAQTRKK